jgi:hypothetical protein
VAHSSPVLAWVGMLRSSQPCQPKRIIAKAMICGGEGLPGRHLAVGRSKSSRNRRDKNTNDRREDSVQQWNRPAQTKIGVERATLAEDEGGS